MKAFRIVIFIVFALALANISANVTIGELNNRHIPETDNSPAMVKIFMGPMDLIDQRTLMFRQSLNISGSNGEIDIVYDKEVGEIVYNGRIEELRVSRSRYMNWLAIISISDITLQITNDTTSHQAILERDEVFLVWLEGSSDNPTLIIQVWAMQFWRDYGRFFFGDNRPYSVPRVASTLTVSSN